MLFIVLTLVSCVILLFFHLFFSLRWARWCEHGFLPQRRLHFEGEHQTSYRTMKMHGYCRNTFADRRALIYVEQRVSFLVKTGSTEQPMMLTLKREDAVTRFFFFCWPPPVARAVFLAREVVSSTLKL